MHNSTLSVVTFNLLAPCYKRLFTPSGQERPDRERDHPHLWNTRLTAILHLLNTLTPTPDIIALQELWFHAPFLARLRAALSPRYHVFMAKRPGAKEDGLAVLVARQHPLLVRPTQVASFPLSSSDRVGLAVSVRLDTPHRAPTTLLVVNAHLSFPHSCIPCSSRLAEADALTSFVDAFAEATPTALSTLVLGDFNADLSTPVCKRFAAAQFRNGYTSVLPSGRPTTHYNHCRQHVFVDHVFFRNQAARTTLNPHPFRRPRHSTFEKSKSGGIVQRAASPSSIGKMGVFDEQTLPLGEALDKRAIDEFSLVSDLQVEVKVEVDMDMDMDMDGSELEVEVEVGMGNDRSKSDGLEPVGCAVYPEGIAHERWPFCFDVSDHRPVGVEFSIHSGDDGKMVHVG